LCEKYTPSKNLFNIGKYSLKNSKIG